MNKKIFTLLASSLMLFIAVFAANAQRPIMGDTVSYLPNGAGKGAYHLHLTRVGDANVARQGLVLALDSFGYIRLDTASTYRTAAYSSLREGLWCVNVKPESAGRVPAFVFTNKEYASNLSVSDDNFIGTTYGLTSADPSKNWMIKPQAHGGKQIEKVLVGGEYERWAFSDGYSNVALDKHSFLRLHIAGKADYFMTFAAIPNGGTAPTLPIVSLVPGEPNYSIRLVEVHANDFKPTSDIYPYLMRFTVVSAAPRVLSATDFNTKIGEQSIEQTRAEGGIQLEFDRKATEGNVFADNKLWATTALGGGDAQYLYVHPFGNRSNYLTVLDGNDRANYYNKNDGTAFPIIAVKPEKNADGRNEFRFVYYPSEDSLIINARKVHHVDEIQGVVEDSLNVADYEDIFDELYTWDMQNLLLVRMQDLDTATGKLVITVKNFPANVRAHFGIKDCVQFDKDLATIESGLYTITDRNGYHLIVDPEFGDFSPTWRKLETVAGNKYGSGEVALKTPSFQWMVTKIVKDSNTSRIHLTNREFEHIRIEYVRVYKSWKLFNGQVNYIDDLNPGADYAPALNRKYVSVENNSFTPVYDDPEAAAVKKSLGANWMKKMPEQLMQKLYRTSPFIGYKYISPDTLNYYGYALNYNTYLGNDFYYGLKDDVNADDSLVHIDRQATFFEFVLPSALKALVGAGRPVELYGIGYSDTLLRDKAADNKVFEDVTSAHHIAKLERSYYHMKVNDYWRYKLKRNDQYLVLDDDGKYAFTDEPNANARKLKKSRFYFRFTYEKNNREFYTLLDRVEKSDFEYLTKTLKLAITDTMKAYDASHGAITSSGFGVVQSAVSDANAYVEAQAKVTTNRLSTFALSQINEPLYRRFNVVDTDGGDENDDTPRLLKFRDFTNAQRFLYEDARSAQALPWGENPRINFLGIESAEECAKQQANGGGSWHSSHNYIIYVDTAYVNRGTGWIKPQYLLVMNPDLVAADSGRVNACGDPVNVERYIYGRYLINATDSAREKGFITATNSLPRDVRYIWKTKNERLAFVDAIHMGDSLYILKGHNIENFYGKCLRGDVPDTYLSKAKLLKAVAAGQIDVHRLDNNLHKDVVFSMRFKERQVDKTGNPIKNASKVFFIESETTNRSDTEGRMIAPMNGGWIKLVDEVPVLSRGSFDSPILAPQGFDVDKAGTNDPGAATSNEDVVDGVKVIAGTGNVTIFNAAGKNVVISNILGQTVINMVLNADEVTIPSPKGILVIAIENEDAVKAVVK